MDKVKINVDGQDYEVDGGQNVLEALRSVGVYVPALCYHPRTEAYGGCRLCIVEIDGIRGLPPSCTIEVQDGMVIRSDTEPIHKVRKVVVELLLAAGDHNCMTCEMNGICTLQELAYHYEIDKPRFSIEEAPVRPTDDNPFILRDYTKCVLCGKCVRVCNEVQCQGAINIMQRGYDAKVAGTKDSPLLESDCLMCGNCVQACPTGALTYRKSRFKGRDYEVEKVRSTCPYCGCGCQMILHVKDGQIVKIEADEEHGPNYGTLCVKGRFGFEYMSSEDRLTTPLIKKGGEFVEATWDEALDFTAQKLKENKDKDGPDSVLVASSAKATNEENYALMKFTRAVLGTNNIDHCARL